MARRHSLDGLMRWVQRDEWCAAFDAVLRRHLAPACTKADVEIEELATILGEDHLMILWGCAFEDFLARDLAGGRNVVDDYLKRRGWKETAPDKAYMAALRNSTMSLYEVSAVVPGESFLARDLVRGGEPVRVVEHSATRSLKQWDRIGARVLPIGQKTVLGGGVLAFDSEASDGIEDLIRRVLARSSQDLEKLAHEIGHSFDEAALGGAVDETAVLRAAAPVFSTVWLSHALRRLLERDMPEVRNSDGEAVEFWTVRYPLRPGASAADIRAAMGAVSSLRPRSDTFWNWVEDPNRHHRRESAAPNKKGLSFVTTAEDGATVLGNVDLKGAALTLSVNSKGRAERGRALLEPALSSLVGAPAVEIRTLEQMMASRPKDGSKASSTGLPPAEERVIVHRSLDRHYAKVLDEPIPVLGNVTPREAAETASGRAKVVEWLKRLENELARRPAGDPMADYDSAWLWETLGVADRRR
jgi:hypothetical protein